MDLLLDRLPLWLPQLLPVCSNSSQCRLLILTLTLISPPHRAACPSPWSWWWWCSAGSASSADSLSSPERGSEMLGWRKYKKELHVNWNDFILKLYQEREPSSDVERQIGRRGGRGGHISSIDYQQLLISLVSNLKWEEEDIFPQWTLNNFSGWKMGKERMSSHNKILWLGASVVSNL